MARNLFTVFPGEELTSHLSTGIPATSSDVTSPAQLLWEGSSNSSREQSSAVRCLHTVHAPSGGKRRDNRPSVLPICLSRSAASSGVARGRTPGSLKLVRSRVPITKKKRIPPIAGMAGVIFSDKYGQLEKEERLNIINNTQCNLLSKTVYHYKCTWRIHLYWYITCLGMFIEAEVSVRVHDTSEISHNLFNTVKVQIA